MQALPFLTAPVAPTTRVVGNSDSGTLRFPVLGGLTVQEAIVMDELLSAKPNAFVEAAKVAESIAKAEDITLVEAFTVIERAVGGATQEDDAEGLRIKYATNIEQVIRVFAASTQHTTEAAVTAFIRCRLDMPQWSIDDTRKQHRRLLQDIYALYQEEVAAEKVEAAPLTEEELGKPRRATGSRRKPTGTT